jgi:hypothetical protein
MSLESSPQLQQLKQLYRSLAPEPGLSNLFDGLTEMNAPSSIFFDPGSRGTRPRLNREHALVRRLLHHSDPEVGMLYLLSSMFSQINRSRPEVDDAMERRFHARVLARLARRS